MRIGAQLFTLHDFCKTTDEFAESLKKVADIGYEIVQVSGTCDYDPHWLKEQLDQNGLRCVLTHIPRERLVGETDAVIAAHTVFDCKNIGLGSFFIEDKDGQRFEDFVSEFSVVSKKLRENGKYFMYHNHDHEFRKEGNKTYFQKLAETFSPEDMGFTLDTFWVQAGGGDPAWWIENLAGRLPCIHLKDYAYGRKMAVLGEGNINFDRVFEKAEKSGVEYMLVEQDDCYGEDPFECLKRSYHYLKARGFE